jgi:hypothetical protein
MYWLYQPCSLSLSQEQFFDVKLAHAMHGVEDNSGKACLKVHDISKDNFGMSVEVFSG